MNNIRIILSVLILFFFFSAEYSEATSLSDDQIKKMIIQESIAGYPGNCPCPYNSARNGSRCGGRSAYSRAGGYNPICYPGDVTREMIKRYRQRLN